MRRFLTLFLVLLILVACGDANDYTPAHARFVYEEETEELIFFNLYFEIANQPLAQHEPAAGALLGIKGGNMGADHAITARSVCLCEPFPLLWVVENIADSAAPLITIIPCLRGDIVEFARQIGIFNMPAFVQFAPLKANNTLSPSAHIAAFRHAAAIFAIYAPHVVMVWGFDAKNITTASHFWPGAEYVGWINMTMYNEVNPDGTFEDGMPSMEVFHNMFEDKAPMMLSVAVSHYCVASNRHFPVQAAEKISKIYAMAATLPRLRAMIYHNHGAYGMAASPILRDTYADIAANPHFIGSIEPIPVDSYATILRSTGHRAVSRGHGFYIPLAAVSINGAPQTMINGELYHNAYHVISYLDADFFINMQAMSLVLQLSSQ